jgi:hypothetical protein
MLLLDAGEGRRCDAGSFFTRAKEAGVMSGSFFTRALDASNEPASFFGRRRRVLGTAIDGGD